MVSSDDLDPSLFPFQDMRYKGNRGGNTGTKPKQKKGGKPATTFAKLWLQYRVVCQSLIVEGLVL